MTGWLLDTNVISELRRPQADKNVVAFVASQPLESLFIGTVTIAEFASASNSWRTLLGVPTSRTG